MAYEMPGDHGTPGPSQKLENEEIGRGGLDKSGRMDMPNEVGEGHLRKGKPGAKDQLGDNREGKIERIDRQEEKVQIGDAHKDASGKQHPDPVAFPEGSQKDRQRDENLGDGSQCDHGSCMMGLKMVVSLEERCQEVKSPEGGCGLEKDDEKDQGKHGFPQNFYRKYRIAEKSRPAEKQKKQGRADQPHEDDSIGMPPVPFSGHISGKEGSKTGGKKKKSDNVEPSGILLGMIAEKKLCHQHCDASDRDIDAERPLPTDVVDNETADGGTQCHPYACR